MLKLAEIAKLGRDLRQDDWDDIGAPTQELIAEAVDDGRLDEAKALGRYMVTEGKALHDLFCDWIWDLLSQVAKRSGEEAMFDVLKDSQSSWMLKRTWRGFLNLSVEERVQLSAEMMRSHRGGPKQDGEIDVIEDDEKFVIRMDPCGSGGRMRRGDPVEGTGSRLEPPYSFGVTQEAHDWAWGKKNVPYYCLHCAVNERMPMEWGGHPLWVTGYEDDAAKPCEWRFYKRAEDIPEEYYSRQGFTKPAAGEGDY